MKHVTLFVLIAGFVLWTSCNKNGGQESTYPEPDPLVRTKIPLADPYILLHDGVYYAYGTGAANGIEAWVSTDLKKWTKGAGKAVQGLVLHKNNVYGNQWFWAPEVYYVDGKFLMYFSAEEHICAATSDSPLGPFVQVVQEPIIKSEKCIDNTLFIDDNDKKYMYFDRFAGGLNICVAELNDDLMSIKGSITNCIKVSQDWERVWPTVNEGCFVIKHNGTYYMTYSANSYESQFYGVGYATAASPLGPWTKYPDNPILQKPGSLVGVGHSAMFRDKEGALKIVFHAHNNTKTIHPRQMYISDVIFIAVPGGSPDRMSISDEYTIPLNIQ
jgi:beta-xylosidase